MLRSILVPSMVLACAFAQSPSGTVSGVIRDLASGAPLAGVSITVYQRGVLMRQVETDASGRYAAGNLTADRVTIRATPVAMGTSVEKTIAIAPGQNLTLDLSVPAPGRISGRITDRDKKPLRNIRVTLVTAEYKYSAPRYSIVGASITDASGDYILPRVESGRAHFILAGTMKPLSKDPEERKPTLMPAYYPGVESGADATPLILAPGEKREMIDFQLRSVPSRCIEGRVQTFDGSQAHFNIVENEPPLWNPISQLPIRSVNKEGEGGKFRFCDLHPGSYVLRVYSAQEFAKNQSLEFVTIGDKDVSGIVASTKSYFQLHGDIVWDVQPFDERMSSEIGLRFEPAFGLGNGSGFRIAGPMPHHFSAPIDRQPRLLKVNSVPAGTYIKDVSSGGRSILNEIFDPDAGVGGLRIVLARDGGRVSLKAAGKENAPVPEANIAVIPASTTTEAAAATAMIIGKTDSYGTWTSRPIAPGKYYVIATTSPVNRGPEAFGKLWRARSASNLIELAPNATVQVNRIPE